MDYNYKIAIPSSGRHNIIKKKTLNLLDYYNINKSNIYIYL